MRTRATLLVSTLVCLIAWLLWPASPTRTLHVAPEQRIRNTPVVLSRAAVSPLPRPGAQEPEWPETPEPPAVSEVEEEVAWGRIVGWVGGEEGVPRGALLFVKGTAAIRALSVPEDGFFELSVAPGRYALHVVGPEVDVDEPDHVVEVEVEPGAEVEVELALEPAARTDPGVVLSETEGGFEVVAVLEGSAADRLGLLPGDRVLSIDGEPASAWRADEITERLGQDEVEAMSVWFEDEHGGFEELVSWSARG